MDELRRAGGVPRVLAVDGGNTKTMAAVADADGRVLATGRDGCSDIYGASSPDAALRAIEEAAGPALARAGAVRAAVFSLAGADWPEDFELLERELRARLALPVELLIVNDALGALRSGSPDWTGMAIVSGTHNAIGARHPDGRAFHLGFWPDGAGARDIGTDGLAAVYRAEMDLGPATVLTEHALALYGASDPIALLHEFTRRGGLGHGAADRFAASVIDAADEGDAVAAAIVAEAGRVLGSQARASAQRIGLTVAGSRAVLSGGVFTHPSDALGDATMAELPGAIVVRHGPPPIVGGLLLGFDRLGVEADPAALLQSLDEGGRAPWAASAWTT
jgi:N-acetylglucosamine kinase-like BadF-type ATPase